MTTMLPLKLNATWKGRKGSVIGFNGEALAVFEDESGKPDVAPLEEVTIQHGPVAEAVTGPIKTGSRGKIRRLSKNMAIWLQNLVTLDPDRNGVAGANVTRAAVERDGVVIGGDYAKLKHWGLIEKLATSSGKGAIHGCWRATPYGVNVVNGTETVRVGHNGKQPVGESVTLTALIDGLKKEKASS